MKYRNQFLVVFLFYSHRRSEKKGANLGYCGRKAHNLKNNLYLKGPKMKIAQLINAGISFKEFSRRLYEHFQQNNYFVKKLKFSYF